MSRTLLGYFLTGILISFLQKTSAVQHATNLIWAQKSSQKFGLAKIVGIEGDPKNWITLSQRLNIRQITAPSVLWHFKALAYHYSSQSLYWSERGNKRIQGLVLNGSTETTNLITGTSSEVDGLVVDWLSNNLYWTDAVYNWIVMVPLDATVKVHKIVVDTGLDRPMGLAIYPQKGYLFWSDWGVRPLIEMSDLLGQNRRVLVKDQLMHPRGLAVDYEENRLYWLDSALDTIQSVEFSGTNRRVLVTRQGTHFYGMALYDKYVFVTENMRGHLQIYNKHTGKNYLNYNLGGNPYGVIMYKQSQQEGTSAGCDNLACEQICVENPLSGPKCYCGDGYDLDSDRSSCTRNGKFVDSTHIYTIGSAICYYPANIADMPLGNISLDTQCFLNDGHTYSALAYDVWNDMLFFSQDDNGTASILRVRLRTGSTKETIVQGVGDVQGLAVDWISSNLYWTDMANQQISVSRLDGSYPKVLVQDGLSRPLGIAVNPYTRMMYWTDPGVPRIESAYLDGSYRQTIVHGNIIGSPNHLFLDVTMNLLYWTDSDRDNIRVHDLTLNLGRTLMAVPKSDLYGISVFKDYVLWTDRFDKNGLHMAVVKTGEKVRGIIHPDVGMATDIVTFSKRNQPTVGKNDPCVNDSISCNPCSQNNGGCQHLCLANNGSTANCSCGVGYQTRDGGVTCLPATDIQHDNFLIVADGSKKEIYQISTDTKAVSALKVRFHRRPVAIDYDPTRGDIYWTDIQANVIKRVNVDGSGEMVVKYLPSDSTADGLAVDYIHRILYYSDTSARTIGVVAMTSPFWGKTLLTTNMDKPRDIALDPMEGYMYWTDWGAKPKIEKTRMDGTHTQTIVWLPQPSWPNGIAIDHKLRRIYWCDARNDQIMLSDLNGQNAEVLFQEKAAHYFGIAIMGDFLYLTDWSRKSIRVLNKNKPDVISPFTAPQFGSLNGIYAYNSSEIIHGTNTCLNSRCAHLCLPQPHGMTVCACADGYSLNIDFISCVLDPNTTTTISTTTSTTTTATTTTTTQVAMTTPKEVTNYTSRLKSTTISTSPNETKDIPNTTVSSNNIPTTTKLPDTAKSQETRERIADGGLPIGVTIGIVFVVLTCLALMAIGAVLYYKRWRRGGRVKLIEEVTPDPTFALPMSEEQPSEKPREHIGIENPMYGCTFSELKEKDEKYLNSDS